MIDEKIAFIYGKEKPESGIVEGKIEPIGKIKDGSFHATYLLDFAKDNYPEVPIFKRLSRRHTPESIAFFYCYYFNHIVFLNTTSFNDKGEITHGKTGRFLLPNNISSKQKEALYNFLEMLDDYSIIILYDLKIDEGIFGGKELHSVYLDTPTTLFNKYFEKNNNTSKTK